jgi:hypothetical protein
MKELSLRHSSTAVAVFGLSCLGALAALPASAAAAEQRYVIVTGSERIGHLVARTTGSVVDIESVVDDNGRGARTTERVELDTTGRPTAWSIRGRGDMGGRVTEDYAWRRGTAQWKTLNDHGQVRVAQAPLYLAADASAWALGAYARALLATPDRRAAVLPSGELRLERLQDVTVGSGARRKTVTAHALWGTGLQPEFLLLDSQGELFARLRTFGAVLPEAYLEDARVVGDLLPALDRAYLTRLAERLRTRIAGPLYIRNVRVFDSRSGRVGPMTTVVTYGGRIVSVRADDPPPGATLVIDGEGGTLVPGLFDAHVHITSGWGGLLHLAAGVTSVRDTGSDNP